LKNNATMRDMVLPDPNKAWALFMSDPVDFILMFAAVVAGVAIFTWFVRGHIDKERIATLEERRKLAVDQQQVTEQIPSPPKEGVSPTSSTSQPPAPGGDRLYQFIANIRGYLADEQVEPAAQMVRSQLDTTFGPTPADQVQGLVYAVTSLNIQLSHEKSYNVIFGSQLRLMAQMIAGGSAEVARRIYEEAKSAFPEFYLNYTFEQWIGFLVGSGLCTAGEGGNYVLTPHGRGFLKYIVDRRLSPNKIF
jgi:hypothetical protein